LTQFQRAAAAQLAQLCKLLLNLTEALEQIGRKRGSRCFQQLVLPRHAVLCLAELRHGRAGRRFQSRHGGRDFGDALWVLTACVSTRTRLAARRQAGR
jgi:hypothetical protein